MKKYFILSLLLCGVAFTGFSQSLQEQETLKKEIRVLQNQINAERAQINELRKQKIKQITVEHIKNRAHAEQTHKEFRDQRAAALRKMNAVRTSEMNKMKAKREVELNQMSVSRENTIKEMQSSRIAAMKHAKAVHKSILENANKEKEQLEKELQNK